MNIEFKQLYEINKSEIIDLMNNPLVRRHMPLSTAFDEKAYNEFLLAKKQLWETHGYGPWAFVVDGKFAGWGGLQYEQGDADLALVLHPNYWGVGKAIYKEIINKAFSEMGLASVTILFPPSRVRIKGLFHLNFEPDGEVEIQGSRFLRYRLYAPLKPS